MVLCDSHENYYHRYSFTVGEALNIRIKKPSKP